MHRTHSRLLLLPTLSVGCLRQRRTATPPARVQAEVKADGEAEVQAHLQRQEPTLQSMRGDVPYNMHRPFIPLPAPDGFVRVSDLPLMLQWSLSRQQQLQFQQQHLQQQLSSLLSLPPPFLLHEYSHPHFTQPIIPEHKRVAETACEGGGPSLAPGGNRVGVLKVLQ